MIPCRRQSMASLVPDGWSRTPDDYRQAAGLAGAVAVKSNSRGMRAQRERFARRRAQDEAKRRALLEGVL